jgi:hypothetical protein
VHGLELKAEDVGGRRNRVDTILVTRVVEHDDNGADGSRDRDAQVAGT